MKDINGVVLSEISGGVDYYIEYNADNRTIGVGFKISF